MSSPIIVKTFAGEFDQLSKIIYEAWQDDYRYFHRYTPDYLHWLYVSPCTEKDLTLGCYDDSQLVGFTMTLVKTIVYNNCIQKIPLVTLLTIKRSPPLTTVSALLREYFLRLKERTNYKEFMIFTKGTSKAKRAFSWYFSANSASITDLSSFGYLIGDVSKITITHHQQDLSAIDSLDTSLIDTYRTIYDSMEADITQKWTPEDIGHIASEPHSICLSFFSHNDILVGAVNGQIIINKNRDSSSLIVENIAGNDFFRNNGAPILIEELVRISKKKGVRYLLLPNTGCVNTKLWEHYGFRPTFSRMDLSLVTLGGTPSMQPIHSFCLEVM